MSKYKSINYLNLSKAIHSNLIPKLEIISLKILSRFSSSPC